MPSITQTDAETYMAERRPFDASHLHGREGHTGTGDLPEEWADLYRKSPVVYTVLSYETPIAWVLESGEVVMPPLRYSLTTTQHQTITYSALTDGGGYFPTEERAVPVGYYGSREGWY